jgi:signal transduction histidine kinase
LQTALTGLVDSVVVLVVWTLLLAGCGLWSTRSGLVLGAVLGLVPLAVFVGGGSDAGPSSLALWVVPLLCGHALRRRQERHAMEIALLRAEAARDAAAERERVATDVHDLLGHALTSIVVQARSAAASLPPDAEATRSSLGRLEDVGREALSELRAVVAQLEQGTRATPVPTHGLASLSALVGRMPIETTMEVSPEAELASDQIQACVYRIVQESLTNTVRHSAATEVRVAVRRHGAELCVEVQDPGPAADDATRGSGRGIDGMARRAAEVGGRLDAGPEGRGWSVHAVLPLPTP